MAGIATVTGKQGRNGEKAVASGRRFFHGLASRQRTPMESFGKRFVRSFQFTYAIGPLVKASL